MPAQTRIIHYYVCLGAAGGKEWKVNMEKEKFDQKEYVKQWTKSNMKTVSVSYKTEFVTEFREACEKLGIKQSAVFRETMEAVIEKAKKDQSI